MNKYDTSYLRHIIDSISRIENFTEDVDENEFKNNELVQSAGIRQMEIIGEASKQLSYELKNKFPEIPCKDIAGMRDKLIHGYFGVDLDIVWDTLQTDLPKLKKSIKDYVKR